MRCDTFLLHANQKFARVVARIGSNSFGAAAVFAVVVLDHLDRSVSFGSSVRLSVEA